MDILGLGKSLDEMIKHDKKQGKGAKKGGIHNKMRAFKKNAGQKKGAGKTPKAGGSPSAKVAKVARTASYAKIRKARGKTLVVSQKGARRSLKNLTTKGKTAVTNAKTGKTLQVNANRRQVLELKRKLRRAIKQKKHLQTKPSTGKKPSAFRAQQPAGRKPGAQQTRQAKRPAKAPVVAASAKAVKERRTEGKRPPRGPIEKRKLKVRNVDRQTVTTQDLKTLFSKCGTLFNCNFDMDEFGQYLGTVTLVYQDDRDAARAIRDYNRAAIDSKVIIVEYSSGSPQSDSGRTQHTPRFKKSPPKKFNRKDIKKR